MTYERHSLKRLILSGWRCGLLLLGCVRLLVAAEPVVVGADGTIRLHLPQKKAPPVAASFRFGLPACNPAKLWRENDVLHGLWETNGLRYRQTVLMTASPDRNGSPLSPEDGKSILLVNIEGENTNADYAQASAALEMTAAGERQQLELVDGRIWRGEGSDRSVLAGFEIPESGIKVSKGQVLHFAGNMPPSLKGSMTLKLPLDSQVNDASADRLADLDFETEVRRVAASRSGVDVPREVQLVFAFEQSQNDQPSTQSGASWIPAELNCGMRPMFKCCTTPSGGRP